MEKSILGSEIRDWFIYPNALLVWIFPEILEGFH
jgi:hypothetical protein